MTNPPDGGGQPSQGIIEAISAFLVAASAWLLRRSGKTPRPTGIATQADIQRLTLAVEAVQSTTDTLDRKIDRQGEKLDWQGEMIIQHGRRLTGLEVLTGNPQGGD